MSGPGRRTAGPGQRSLHSYAWMAWVATVMVVALTTTNPLYLVLVLLSVVLVGVVAPKDGIGTAGLKAMVTFGVVMLALAILVATINGTYGSHVLFTIPGPRFPDWLGGLRLGGPVTLESFAAAIIRALAAFSVFLGFAVFSAAVSVQKLVRAAPAAVFHLGLVITIGLSLLPSSIEDLRRIREMQALRGAPTRLRQVPGLVVPAVIGGLERSMRLAEAMEARGVASQETQPTRQMRFAALLPAPLILAGMWLWFYALEWRVLAGVLFAAAVASLVLWGRLAKGQGKRTRLRDEPFPMFDRILTLGSLSIAFTVFVARQMDAFGLNYNPFADLPVPGFTPIGAALMVCSAWPAFVLLLLPASADEPARTVAEEAEPAWR